MWDVHGTLKPDSFAYFVTVTPLLTMFVDVALSAPYVTLSAAKGLLLPEEEILRRLRLLRMT